MDNFIFGAGIGALIATITHLAFNNLPLRECEKANDVYQCEYITVPVTQGKAND